MFQNPNVLLDFSNYGPVDDWTQVTVSKRFRFFLLFPFIFLVLCSVMYLLSHADSGSSYSIFYDGICHVFF